MRYAKNGVAGPDGALTGASAEGTVNATTGRAELRITSPGRYAAVARARGFTGATGQFFTPWTAPAIVRAVAPFDLQSARFIDENGPIYRVSIKLREPTARGRVRLAWARGASGGRFIGLGTARAHVAGQLRQEHPDPPHGRLPPARGLPRLADGGLREDRAAVPGQPAGRLRALAERDHAADAVLGLHQLEPAVDLVQRDAVRDERVDVDVAGQVAVDELGHLVAALDAAERRAGDAPAR